MILGESEPERGSGNPGEQPEAGSSVFRGMNQQPISSWRVPETESPVGQRNAKIAPRTLRGQGRKLERIVEDRRLEPPFRGRLFLFVLIIFDFPFLMGDSRLVDHPDLPVLLFNTTDPE